MYPVGVLTEGGNTVQTIVAHAFARMCTLAGFEDVTLHSTPSGPSFSPAALTMSANLTRLVTKLVGDELLDEAHRPDREQVRLLPSGYLLSELPLGAFAESRYGAPLVNIDTSALAALLVEDGRTSAPAAGLAAVENDAGMTVNLCASDPVAASHPCELHHAALEQSPSPANVTWLGTGRVAWQFSTKQHTHFFFAAVGEALDAGAWPGLLGEAAAAAQPVYSFGLTLPEVATHWIEGRVAHLGDGAYAAHPFQRESRLLGLEDAWVLSRMLENYETDTAEALAEYARFRKPRAARVRASSNALAASYLAPAAATRLWRNLGIAVRTRFLPEMAMHRIDWLYQYDCIRGFR